MRACILVVILALAGVGRGEEAGQIRQRPSVQQTQDGRLEEALRKTRNPEEAMEILQRFIAEWEKRIAQIETQLPAAQKKAESLPLPIEVQQVVAEKGGSLLHIAARQAIDSIIARHHASLQQQDLELIGLQARRGAIDRAMVEQSVRLKLLVKEDAITAQLQAVVEAKEQYLAHLKQMHEHGRVGTGEITQAVASVAEARARLLERQETVADRAGGDVLAAWNRELMNLSVDLVEKQAKMQALQERVSSIRNAVKAHEELFFLQAELGTLRRNLAVVRDW